MTSLKKWHLYVDGASRGNPGVAGAGIYLMSKDGVVTKRGYFLGKKTNNEAEYLALLIGVSIFKKVAKVNDHLFIFSDSLLLIKQMTGEYRVRKPELQQLHVLIKKILEPFACTFAHVYRDNNMEADALANKGIDNKISLPLTFISFLSHHEIYL